MDDNKFLINAFEVKFFKSIHFTKGQFILLLMSIHLASCGYYGGSIEEMDGPSSSTTDQPSLSNPTLPPSNQPIIISDNKVSVSDLVAGSYSLQASATKNYKIISSTGIYKSELVTKSQKGYTIYSTSLGTLISTQGATNVK